MLALDFVKANGGTVEGAIRDKGVDLDLAPLRALDTAVRAAKTEIDRLRAERNAVSARFKDSTPEEKAELGRQAKGGGWGASGVESGVAGKEAGLKALMLKLPGIPYEGAPVGPDESANVVIRTVGEPPAFDFQPLDHVALLEKNAWADLSRVTPVSGSRTYCLKGALALLETKLMGWALEKIANAGFTPITVPAIAREQAFLNQGQFPGHREETYELPNDDLWLAGTAEVVLTSLHSGEIIEADKLPILYAGYSPCFPREAGRAGKDVRRLRRVHQFVKVQQYVICRADDAQSAKWHARLLGLAEQLLQAMEIPYQVIETSTGDMGLGKYRMNDIATWVPSLDKYRETHSCSTLHAWQARRANRRLPARHAQVRAAPTVTHTPPAPPRRRLPRHDTHP